MPPEIRLYEALFLFNPAVINSSVNKATEIVQELLNRASAETVSIAKWDDRKLSYEISGVKRGLYMLAYFRAAGAAVGHIENDVNLSEQVMRVLILRADHVGETELGQALERQTETRTLAALEGQTPPPAPAAAAPAPAAEPAAQE
jgi:small subunit ribosomal protein S6